ncbi:MAG: hypothetical protein AAGC44_06515 [Planctomycetota bacterium]
MRYVNHVSGAWIALSQWTTQGFFYPPLEFDGNYGGTRFGPLAIALQAGAHWLSGDPIVGAKLLHAIYVVAIIFGIWTLLGPLNLPRHLRLFLSVSVLMSPIGWEAGLAIRHDGLATALQLWAVILVARQSKHPWFMVVLVAMLATLAVLAKLSALWGGAACMFYLAWTAPKKLFIYIPTGLVMMACGLGLVEWFSGGYFFENMAVCLFPSGGVSQGMDRHTVIHVCKFFLKTMITDPLLLLMVIFSVAGIWRGWRVAPHFVIAYILVCFMSVYLLTRNGIDRNHLIDFLVVSALGAGLFLSGRTNQGAKPRGEKLKPGPVTHGAGPVQRGWVLAALLAASLLYVVLPKHHNGTWFNRPRAVQKSVATLLGADPPIAVLEQFGPDDKVISFNPAVPVLLGQNPVVIDSWMLRVYFEQDREAEAEFVRRVQAQEFDAFVFSFDVGEGLDFADEHFGALTLDAVRQNYRLDEVGAFAVFRPIPRD